MELRLGMSIKSIVDSPKVSKGTQQFVGTWEDSGKGNGYVLKSINWQCSRCGKINDDKCSLHE